MKTTQHRGSLPVYPRTVTVTVDCPVCDTEMDVVVDIDGEHTCYDAPVSCTHFDGPTRRGYEDLRGPYTKDEKKRLTQSIEDATVRLLEEEAR